MIFLRNCPRRDGRRNPQHLKKAVTCDLGVVPRGGEITLDTFYAPKPFDGADIVGVSFGNEGCEVIELTQTLDIIAKRIVKTCKTEQEAEAEARRLANPPEETVDELVEDLIVAAFMGKGAA